MTETENGYDDSNDKYRHPDKIARAIQEDPYHEPFPGGWDAKYAQWLGRRYNVDPEAMGGIVWKDIIKFNPNQDKSDPK